MAKKKSNAGRPTVMTDEVLAKLEYAFGIGCSDREAVFYANVSLDALYDYCNKYPEFGERKEALKLNPIIKARETVCKAVETPQNAQWYLERKRKDEFSLKQELEHSTPPDRAFKISISTTDAAGKLDANQKTA
jgi:hypothetical protein